MKTFCHLIGKYFGIIAVVFLILGMTVPDSFKWVVGNIGGIPVLSTFGEIKISSSRRSSTRWLFLNMKPM